MGDGEDADRAGGPTVLSRRRAIAVGGGIAGLSLAGGIGSKLVDRAAASAAVSFDAADVSIATSDGSIDAVTIEPTGSVTWANLESEPKETTFELIVANDASMENDGDATASTIVETGTVTGKNSARSGSIEVELSKYDLLNDGAYENSGYAGDGTAPFDASDFEAVGDGERQETTVYLELTVSLSEKSQGPALATASDRAEFTVTVSNAEAAISYDVTANTGVESDTAVDGSDTA